MPVLCLLQGKMNAASPYECPGTLCKLSPLPEDYCSELPERVSLGEGVLLERDNAAVHMAKLFNVKSGGSVIVYGAGTVGFLCGAVAAALSTEKVLPVDDLERISELAKGYFDARGTLFPDSKASAETNAERVREEHDLGD